MTTNSYFKVGNVLSPLTGSTTSPSLNDLDPPLTAILGFFEAILQRHLGPRWDAEVRRLNREDWATSFIAQSIPYDPMPVSTESELRFPLLAIYPTESEYEQKTSTWYVIHRAMDVLVMLPPLSSEQNERLLPFLAHAERTLVDRSNDGFDTLYGDGRSVYAACGVSSVTLKGSTYGKVPGRGAPSDIFFPTLQVRMVVSEHRETATQNFEPFAGVLSGSIDIASGSADSGSVSSPFTDFISFRT